MFLSEPGRLHIQIGVTIGLMLEIRLGLIGFLAASKNQAMLGKFLTAQTRSP